MDKIWFIKVEEEPEGPYSVEELRWDNRISPSTMAWHEGMPAWLPMHQIPELAILFSDDEGNGNGSEDTQGGEKVLTLDPDPQRIYYIIILVALLALISLYFLFL